MTHTIPTDTALITTPDSPSPRRGGGWGERSFRDSGIPWLGPIPAHWQVAPLKRITAYVARGDSPDYVDDSSVRVINQACVQWDRLHLENVKFQRETDISTWDSRLRYGDVLVNSTGTGTLGRTVVFRESGVYMADGHVTIVRCLNALAAPTYVSYLLGTQLYQGYIYSALVSGSTNQIELSREGFRAMAIILPPLPEQRAIAAYLDRETARLDALIAAKQRLISLLQEKRAALISRAVTRGLDPTAPLRDSGIPWLGAIPAHWEVKRIKHLTQILRGKFSHRPRNDPNMYDGSYPFIQTGDIAAADKYLTHHQQTLNEAGFAVSKEFPVGTLVMSIAANIGDLAILGIRACFPDSIVGFVPSQDLSLEYLYYNLSAMREEMMTTATINTQLNLNIERIGTLFTVCPPVSEQRAIAAYLDRETAKLDTLIASIRQHIEKVREYRAALISAAVTGKLDVCGAVEPFASEPEGSAS